jgi:predicted membrane channel-forming protein YqfA (hemolysin III family)
MLKWSVASDATMDRSFYWIFGILAIVIMVVGTRKICEFSPTLTEAQLYLSVGVLLVSVFQCMIISILYDKKRKAA